MGVARAHLFVSLAVAATFLRGLGTPLQPRWDDGRFILDNPLTRDVSLAALQAIFTRTHFQAYHPLHLASYWLDVPWTDADPLALHATSLVLWVLAANAVLAAMRGLGLGPVAAALATLAYALHPVQVEAVTWAAGRKDALAALFGFGALVFHLRAGVWNDRHAWLARAAFLCAVLSKTSALPLPFLFWLGDVLLRGRRPSQAAVMQLPSLAITVALAPLVVTTWSDSDMIRPEPGSPVAPFVRVANTIAHQLTTALWPSATAPMYSTRAVEQASAGAFVIAASTALLAAFWYRVRAKRAVFALLGFLILLAPVANAIPLYFPWQDRYLSLPTFGLAFGLGAWVEGSARRRRAGSIGPLLAAAGLVALLAARTVQYQGAWASERRLWEHAASVHPDAYYAWLKLGEVRREMGDLDGAVRAYGQLLALEPNRRLGYAALCQARAELDERRYGLVHARAEAYARELHANLDDAPALRGLASRMLTSGYLGALEVPLARALALEPYPDETLERAALVQARAGRASIARFYLARMRRPTRDPELVSLLRGRLAGATPVLP